MTTASPPADAEPAVAKATCEATRSDTAVGAVPATGKGGQDRTVSAVTGGQDRTVSAVKGGQDRTVSAVKGGQDRTVSSASPAERGPQRGPERGPPNARAGKEPGNQGTSEHPPNPPEGGLIAGELFVEESYLSERGRRRKRLVPVDVDALRRELTPASCSDEGVWRSARALMLSGVGEAMFEIWLASVEVVAVARDGSLVISAPEATSSWVQSRFGRLISHCCEQSGRGVRFASPQERVAMQHLKAAASSADAGEQATVNRRVS